MYPYGEAHAAWYDALYESLEKDAEAEGRTLLTLASEQLGRSPRSWLDVGCGTGRHLAVFASEVDEVVGVDLSDAMLDVAAARLPSHVRLVAGDQCSLDLGRRFEVVSSLFSSVGYVEDRAEALATVGRLADHVEPDGVLLLEPWLDPADWRDGEPPQVVQVADGARRAVRVVAASRAGDVTRLDVVLVTAGGGRVDVQREEHRMVMVPRGELEAAAHEAGLQVSWREGPSGRGLLVGRRLP